MTRAMTADGRSLLVGVAVRLRLRRPVASQPDHETEAIAALDRIAREMRSGSSLPAALADALGAHPTVLADVRCALGGGEATSTALHEAVAARCFAAADAGSGSGAGSGAGSPVDTLALQALRACHRAGGSGVEAIERASSVLRERRAWQAERWAQGAQARLSARLLTLLPVAFALWGAVTSDRVRQAYSGSPVPGVCTTIGIVLNLIGWRWMNRLVRGLA